MEKYISKQKKRPISQNIRYRRIANERYVRSETSKKDLYKKDFIFP